MSAALRIAARWAFTHGAPSLDWYAARRNLASWRVAHACGFTHHGSLPQRVPVRDGTADAWRASLLPGEPMTPRHTWVVPPLVEVGGLRLRPLRDDDRAIADVASDDPLGEVLVFTRGGELVEGGTAELGDSVRPSAHGRGQRGEQQDARRRRVHAVGPRGGCRGP
ncbi:GNAT family N-acetyltransferase [Janibacter hoylei]|nr:GNAT family N-acetyltransferase [Janibacter hoylei]MCT2292508.1 GNAT family N-acetyltransferase [Janibacter hoylei]